MNVAMPFFSIITATYNAEKRLSRLLDSLAAQTCRDFNWIMQDGLSTDRTWDIAASYRERLPAILAQRAPDTGIYDAWNKALDRVGENLGQWVLFLGADDLLAADTVLAKAKARLSLLPETILYCCGDLVQFSEDGSLRKKRIVDTNFSFQHLYTNIGLPHSALFHKNSVFHRNRFNPHFKIAGDHDFLIKNWQDVSQACGLGFIVTWMSTSGCSSHKKYALLFFKEKIRIQKEHFPFFYYKNLPKNLLILLNFTLHPQKILLKKYLRKYKYGKLLWAVLSFCRKKIIS